MTKWILILTAAAGLYGQTHVARSSQTTVTSDKLTVQHSPSAPTRVQMCYAVVQSTTAGTVKVEVGGAAATATAATRSTVVPGGSTAKALAYSASDVGAGTAISVTEVLAANTPKTIPLKHVFLSGAGTTKNVTLVITLASGNVESAIYWAEDGVCQN